MGGQKILLFIIILLAMISCAKIYYSPDVSHKANAHQHVCIMPPVISIKSMEEGDYMAYKKQMAYESSTFQKEM